MSGAGDMVIDVEQEAIKESCQENKPQSPRSIHETSRHDPRLAEPSRMPKIKVGDGRVKRVVGLQSNDVMIIALGKYTSSALGARNTDASLL